MNRFKLYLSIFLLNICLNSFGQITILSGPKDEIYNRFANDIKNNTFVNVQVIETEGSSENLNRIKENSNQLSFLQYDVLLKKELENPKIKENLKLFLPLYDEEIHLITKNNNSINSLQDLVGKRVGIGSENSGSFVTAGFIKMKTGIQWKDIIIPFTGSFDALMKDSIDAFFYVVAAPSTSLKSLSKDLESIIKLVPIKDKRLKDFYSKKEISKDAYPWMTSTIETYAVRSIIAVNTTNMNPTIEKELDRLYNDLKDNLKGIQMNKFSHTKWRQVDFTNLEGIDWPIYKEEYVTYKVVFNWLAYIAVFLTIFQIYFIINKLWSRKHERLVAESISINAMFISITINSFFAFKNLVNDGIPQLIANIFWIVASAFSILVGVGIWVVANKDFSFLKLLRMALHLEKKEAGDLAKAFFRPSGAEHVIDILGRIAMVDEDLDEKEKEYIQGFADQWGINLNWDDIKKYAELKVDKYEFIRDSMDKYLKSSPPEEQASQLSDVLNILVNIDGKVTDEEETILAELQAQVSLYLGKADGLEIYKVALVPQSNDEEKMIKSSIVELSKEDIAGGYAYLSEPFYSEKYAEIVAAKYRVLNVFSVVFKPEHFKEKGNLQQAIDNAKNDKD